MQTRSEQSNTGTNKNAIRSDWRRMALFIVGMLFAVAGFSRYVADITAILS